MAKNLKQPISSLSEIERETLRALRGGEWLSAGEISRRASLNPDSARRACAWLVEKGMAGVNERKERFLQLNAEGRKVLDGGFAEIRLMRAVQESGGRETLQKLKEKLGLDDRETNIALGIAKRNAWVAIRKTSGMEGEVVLELTGLEKDALSKPYPPEEVLKKAGSEKKLTGREIAGREKPVVEEMVRRGLLEWRESAEREFRISGHGKDAISEPAALSAARTYDIRAPVPEIFSGKRQPYVQFLNRIRRKMVELGFKEMKERLIVQEFYNFDVLFQPQNHPARSWSDTYQMGQPRFGKLPAKKFVDAVRNAHENGGASGSRGWGYKWDEKIASRLMPNAHGTTADARQMVEGIDIPGKYFVINRCYRPDVVDATHLVEFNQCDGFVAGEGLNFRSLLAVLKQFALEVAGAEKVRFVPDYYPFTEPSVQLSALHPEMGWIEFAGAGVFRPEITENMGFKETAIAWGMGIDRLAMFKLGIKDIRYLFSDSIDWLRRAPLLG